VASQGDPDYAKFWDRVVNNPKESTYKTVEEGLDHLVIDNTVKAAYCNHWLVLSACNSV